MFRTVRSPLIALVVTAGVLAFGARLALLGTRNVNVWEATTVLFAEQPLRKLFDSLAYDVHPPLFFLIAAGWIKLFGATPLSLRLFGGICSGVLASVAAAMAWHLSRTSADRRLLSAATAGLYAALSPAAVASTGIFRMYGLTAVGALLLFWSAGIALRRPPRSCMAAIVLLGTLLGYLHYVGVMLCVALLCAWLWTATGRSKRPLVIAAVLGLAWAILWAPWALTVLGQTAAYHEAALDVDTLVSIAQSLCYWLLGFREAPGAVAVPAALAGVVLVVILARRIERPGFVLVGAAVGAGLLATSALVLQPVVANPRFWGPIVLLAVVAASAAVANQKLFIQLLGSGVLVSAQMVGLLHMPPQGESVSRQSELVIIQLSHKNEPVTVVAPPAEAVLLEYYRKLRRADNIRVRCLTEVEPSRHEPQRAALPRESWTTQDELKSLRSPIYLVREGRAILWTPDRDDWLIP